MDVIQLADLPWTWDQEDHCVRGESGSIIFDNSCQEFSYHEEKAIAEILLKASEESVLPTPKSVWSPQLQVKIDSLKDQGQELIKLADRIKSSLKDKDSDK